MDMMVIFCKIVLVEYVVCVIDDMNGNGKWDSGNYL